MELKDALRRLRESIGKSQVDVAKDLNVKVETYRSWERGKREPSIEMLCQIAEYYSVSLDTVAGFRLSDDEFELMLRYMKIPHDDRRRFAQAILGSDSVEEE